jgi:hypothetical protein
MTMLKMPLAKSQVAAAVGIRSRLPHCRASDRALTRLAERLPGFDHSDSLIKAAAINQLYGANLYAVPRMGEHIARVMRKSPTAGAELVERIACVPALEGKAEWRHFSFASKFCHFFVDREACPIFDKYADAALRLHLGRALRRDSHHRYAAFVENLKQLRAAAALTVPAVELDNYLWIRGAYQSWRRKPDAPLNGELRAFFEGQASRDHIRRLVGEA